MDERSLDTSTRVSAIVAQQIKQGFLNAVLSHDAPGRNKPHRVVKGFLVIFRTRFQNDARDFNDVVWLLSAHLFLPQLSSDVASLDSRTLGQSTAMHHLN